MCIRFGVVLLLLIVLSLLGCTGKGSSGKSPHPTQSTEEKKPEYYSNKTVGYRVLIPKGWIIEQVAGVDLFMKSKEGSFTPEPSVNIISTKIKKYDLANSVNQKKIKDQIMENLKVAEEKTLKINGENAYRLVYGVEQNAISIIVNQTYFFCGDYLLVVTCGCREDEYLRFEEIFTNIVNNIEFVQIESK